MDRSIRARGVGQAAAVRADDQTVNLLVRAEVDSTVVLESQKDVTCRVEEVTVADVRPGDVPDAVVEGDQVSRDEDRLGKRASRGLIVTAGQPDLVGARGGSRADARTRLSLP